MNEQDPSQWLIKTKQGEVGPISRKQMEKLVLRGKLPPGTPIRRKDDQNWERSDRINRYEAKAAASASQRPHTAPSEANVPTANAPAKITSEATTNAAASIKGVLTVVTDASKLASLKALALPTAKAALACKAIESGLVPEKNPHLAQIRKTELEMAELQEAVPVANRETIGQKASRFGKEAKRKLQIKVIRQRLHKEHVALGGSIHTSSGDQPPPEIQPELQRACEILETITVLESSIESRPHDKKKAILAVAVVGALLLIGGGTYLLSGDDDSTIAFSHSTPSVTQPDAPPSAAAVVVNFNSVDQSEPKRLEEAPRGQEEQNFLATENKQLESAHLALAKQEREDREERARAADEKSRGEAASKGESERKHVLARQNAIETAMKHPADWLLVYRPSTDGKFSRGKMEIVNAESFESLGPVSSFGKTVFPILDSFFFFGPVKHSFGNYGVVESPGAIWNPIVSDGRPSYAANRSIIYAADRIRCLKIVEGDLVRGVINWKGDKEIFDGKLTNIGLVDKFVLRSWRGNTLTMVNPSNPENAIIEIDLISGDFTERPKGAFEQPEGTVRLSDSLLLQTTNDHLRFLNLESHEIRELPNKQYFSHPAIPGKKDATVVPLVTAPRLLDRRGRQRPSAYNATMLGGDICVFVTAGRSLLAVHVPTMQSQTFDFGFGDQPPIKGGKPGQLRILNSIGKQVICQINHSDKAELASELFIYKRLDLSTGAFTTLPPSCLAATWIDTSHFIYLVTKGGVGEVGVWLHDVEKKSDTRLSVRPELGDFFLTSDRKSIFADLNGWKRVELSSGELRAIDALASATQVIRFEDPLHIDLDAENSTSWGPLDKPKYFEVSQAAIPGLVGRELELSELMANYDGAVRESLERIIVKQSRSERCLDKVAYIKLIAPVVSQMAKEGKDVDFITNGWYEYPVRDSIASCVDDDLLRIAIYETCFRFGSREWYKGHVSETEKNKVAASCLRTVETVMGNRKVKESLIDCRVTHNTKSLTAFGSTVNTIFSSFHRK